MKKPAPRTSGPSHSPISRPVFERVVTLQSNYAQNIFDRHFDKMARNLFYTTFLLRVMGNQHLADEAQNYLSGLLDQAGADIQAEAERLEALREDNGISDLPRYTQGRTYTIEITTPHAARVLGQITQMDQLMARLDALWLYGVLNDKQKVAGSNQWRRRLVRLSHQIEDLMGRTRAAARRAGIDDATAATAEPEASEAVASEPPVEIEADAADAHKDARQEDETPARIDAAVG